MRPFKFRLLLGFLIVAVGYRYETVSGNNPEYAFLGLGFASGIVSCLSAANNGAVTDGDYLLTLPGGTVSVFCYGMTSILLSILHCQILLQTEEEHTIILLMDLVGTRVG